ncbi:single-stranded DNA-binding protein [bacterium D16-51]|nr:single-stranded DNA-binding protein [bacterium D16-51]
MKNNTVMLIGTVVENFTYNHETHNEKFYSGFLSVKRNSSTEDILPIIASEYLIDANLDYSGKLVSIYGDYRSRNNHASGKSTLDLYVFVSCIEAADKDVNLNSVSFQGFICKTPVYRKTPGGWEICDLFVAVNGSWGREYYIPCIAWGRNAIKASRFTIRDMIRISGRIQSRRYQKKLEEGGIEERTAYEVSASEIEIVESEE